MECSAIDFLEKKGEEKAKNYVQANQDAVEEYKRIVWEKGLIVT